MAVKKTATHAARRPASKEMAAPSNKSKALASNSLLSDMAKHSGKGIEDADKDSFAIPFILCLQSNSPQLETVEGSKAGLFINSVTNELFKSVIVVPVYFERQFLRWIDRDAGGGFKGAYTALEAEEMIASGEAERDEDGIHIRIGETESLSDTRQHYVLVQDSSGSWTPAVVVCASTQIKKSKNWVTQINNFKINVDGSSINPPSWARTYMIQSTKESNAKGSWYGITITPYTGDDPVGLVDADLYRQGVAFYEQIKKGRVKVMHEDLATADADDSEGDSF